MLYIIPLNLTIPNKDINIDDIDMTHVNMVLIGKEYILTSIEFLVTVNPSVASTVSINILLYRFSST